jgi:hypothetical protein
MKRSDKTRDDFMAFIAARERLFLQAFEEWGLSADGDEGTGTVVED